MQLNSPNITCELSIAPFFMKCYGKACLTNKIPLNFIGISSPPFSSLQKLFMNSKADDWMVNAPISTKIYVQLVIWVRSIILKLNLACVLPSRPIWGAEFIAYFSVYSISHIPDTGVLCWFYLEIMPSVKFELSESGIRKLPVTTL